VGTADMVEHDLRVILKEAQPDEFMLAGHFHDHAARLRSFEIAAQMRERLI
jgi:hypothetical protein